MTPRTPKTLKRILWKLVSEYIRQKESGICFTCGKRENWKYQHCGHFIPRGSYSDTMYDEVNLHCQCPKCNTFLHGNLTEYTIRMIEKYGKEKVDELRARGRKVKKWKIDELEELINYYKEK